MSEILALAGVALAIGAYLYVKKSRATTTKEQEIALIEDAYETPQKAPLKPKPLPEEYHHQLHGSEEGDFGENEQPAEAPKSTPREGRYKRDVPPHGKVTKESFKEFKGHRILIAEDNMINQKVISSLLAESGMDIVIADDGQFALDILEKDPNFLMVLMDAHMPRVDGFQATRAIRKNPAYDHIVVVALSGDTAADDIKKMQEAGMEEHLEKPLRMDALYDVLYAYSGKAPKTQKSDEYVEVIITQELQGDKGLQICGGDEQFYHEILDEFVHNYATSAEELIHMLEAHKLKEADKLLLDICGVSANIGADTLYNVATELKDSLKDTQEKSYMSLVSTYDKHLKALLQDIKNYKSGM
ncbi:MAG: response regulator [Epsilonproteobacteria bacterium]|nr:response regulator [Campylobacterota bacterium]